MRLSSRCVLMVMVLALALLAAGCTGPLIVQAPAPTRGGPGLADPFSSVLSPQAEAAATLPTTAEAGTKLHSSITSPSATVQTPDTTPLIAAQAPTSTTPPSAGNTPTAKTGTPAPAATESGQGHAMDNTVMPGGTAPVMTPGVQAAPGTPAATPAAPGQASTNTEVLYQDDFTDPTSGWPNELVFQDYYIGYHEPDFYHVEVHTPNDSAIVTVPERTFDNFSAETRVQISAANTAPTGDFRYGLAVRRTGNRYYAFAISPRTKTWYVLKSSSGKLEVLGQGTQDSIRGLQAQDTLRVNAQGPLLTFFVNGQPVSQINDADYTGGGVGFYVETFDSPKAHIHYDSLIISQPENLPAQSILLYQDDFTDPTSGWPNELVFQDYYIGYHEPDFYHVEVHTPNDSAIVTVPERTFDNFSAETRVQISAANTAPSGDFRYGLAVRRTGNRYYAFAISPRTKTWYVLKSSSGKLEVLGQGTQDSIRGLQAQDTLRVNAQGPLLTFFVNGQPVSQINDADYTGGGVGFYVETFDSPKAHIHYDSLIISQPENLPAQAVPSPTPQAPLVTCTVIVDLLRLHPLPRLGGEPAIAGLFKGTQLDALARSPDGAWIWVRIHGSNQEGWVITLPSLLSCDSPIAGLPEHKQAP